MRTQPNRPRTPRPHNTCADALAFELRAIEREIDAGPLCYSSATTDDELAAMVARIVPGAVLDAQVAS